MIDAEAPHPITEDEFIDALKKASQPTDQVEDLEDEDEEDER